MDQLKSMLVNNLNSFDKEDKLMIFKIVVGMVTFITAFAIYNDAKEISIGDTVKIKF